jgi:predicted nucleic acid-binding protein
MEYLFLDTNAFLKLYLNEKGSNWIRTYVADKSLFVSQLVFIESATSLGRLYREGKYTRDQADSIYAQIRKERPKFGVVPLGAIRQTERVAFLAFNLPNDLRLRALDALHLVAAEIVLNRAKKEESSPTLTLVSSDVQLLKVAQAQGFVTENPEDYA